MSERIKPEVGGVVFDWERGLDPWHRDAFPTEFKDSAPNQEKRGSGWYAIDYHGNEIGFLPDEEEKP